MRGSIGAGMSRAVGGACYSCGKCTTDPPGEIAGTVMDVKLGGLTFHLCKSCGVTLRTAINLVFGTAGRDKVTG